jgi:hypothetical protein
VAPLFETRSTAKQVGLVWRGVKFGFKRIVTYNEGWGIAMQKRFKFKLKINFS